MQVDGLIKICNALSCDLVVREADPLRSTYRDALVPIDEACTVHAPPPSRNLLRTRNSN